MNAITIPNLDISKFSESQFSEGRVLDDFDNLQETINRSKSTHDDRERIRSGSPHKRYNNHYYDEDSYATEDNTSFIKIKDSQPQERQKPPRRPQH